MIDWQERFYAFIAEWLREAKHLPCAKVTYVEHEAEEWFDYSDAHGVSLNGHISWIDNDGGQHREYFNSGIEDLFY